MKQTPPTYLICPIGEQVQSSVGSHCPEPLSVHVHHPSSAYGKGD